MRKWAGSRRERLGTRSSVALPVAEPQAIRLPLFCPEAWRGKRSRPLKSICSCLWEGLQGRWIGWGEMLQLEDQDKSVN